MPLVMAVVAAGRGRGKTALVELICRALSGDFTVWTVKHLSQSFDLRDKDTWRHMAAGAYGTIAVSPEEVVTLKSKRGASVEDALDEVPAGVDLVLAEGFRKSLYPKVLVARTVDEAMEQLRKIEGVFALHIPGEELGSLKAAGKIPVLSEGELIERVREMVVADQVKRLPGINCRKCGFSSCDALGKAIREGSGFLRQCRVLQESDLQLLVDGHQVYLSPFPKSFVKNVLLAMVGTLKGVDGSKMARLLIEVRKKGGRTDVSPVFEREVDTTNGKAEPGIE